MLDGANFGSTLLDGCTARGVRNILTKSGDLGSTLNIDTTERDAMVILGGIYCHCNLQSCVQTLTLERN